MDEASSQQFLSQLKAKAAEKETELARARELIKSEIASESPLADVAALAQLDTRIEFLQQQGESQDRQTSATLPQLASGNPPALLAELDQLG